MATSTTPISTSLSKTQPNLSRPPQTIFKFNFSLSSNFRRRKNFPATCCLNLPHKPESSAGRSLSSVLQNEPHSFYDAVSAQLIRVKEDREAALARSVLSLGSSEALLHKRIAELKEVESQLAVEDVLYMIISYKFSEIRVPLVPSLSECLYNGRLEIVPSKDWELESIHSLEVLEMVREHLSTVIGWKAGSSVAVNWSTTKVQRHLLRRVYEASILFGYFLKSASRRLHLERSLPSTYHQNIPFGSWMSSPKRESCGYNTDIFGHKVTPRSTTLSQVTRKPGVEEASLRRYVTGFDMRTVEQCTKLKSEEAVELINKHCIALFGNDNAENNKMILTSLSSMKRLVLEAVAFGCFLWDAEQCVNSVYELTGRY